MYISIGELVIYVRERWLISALIRFQKAAPLEFESRGMYVYMYMYTCAMLSYKKINGPITRILSMTIIIISVRPLNDIHCLFICTL